MSQSMNCFVFAAVSLSALASAAWADVQYSYRDRRDNGSIFTDHVAISIAAPGTPIDLWWANQYDVLPGGNVLTSVDIAFFDGWDLGTSPISVMIYDDPNANGLPDDLVLLTRVDTVASQLFSVQAPDVMQNIDIPDTVVSGSFFVAIQANSIDGGAQIVSDVPGFDPGQAGNGSSWLASNTSTHGTLDPTDLGAAELTPTLIDDLTLPGSPLVDWVIEVNAIPAPSGALPVLAAAGLMANRRRRS